jgi:hypothetical protein
VKPGKNVLTLKIFRWSTGSSGVSAVSNGMFICIHSPKPP